jgi:16S rRNA (uracil1498-N3)-methyltransferase
MRQYRFFVSPDQIRGPRLKLTGSQARQVYSVLRMREADHILALDNRGWQYEVRLDKVTSRVVTGEIIARKQAGGEPRTELTLYQALLKKSNFEWVLQKGTELGVKRFVPLISQRCVVRNKVIKPAKLERWQRIIGEAAEQSGRGRLPELFAPLTLPEALDDAVEYDSALIPWEGAAEPGLTDALNLLGGECSPAAYRIALFIGPEGGFADEEVEEAEALDVQPVTLGSRILRAETAAVVAATLALSAMGDLD